MPTVCPTCGTRNLQGVDACCNCGSPLTQADLPKPDSAVEQAVMQLPLTCLEFKPAHSLAPDDPVSEAVLVLAGQGRNVVAVLEGGHLVGVLSTHDLMHRMGGDYRQKLGGKVRDFMTPAPVTLPPDAPLTYALHEMAVGGYRHVPIVQGDRPVGVVSAHDVVRYIVKNTRQRVETAGKTTSHGVHQGQAKAAAKASA